MANVAKIIVSNPSVACTSYGLSDEGRVQAQRAGTDLVERYYRSNNRTADESSYCNGIVVVSSDLLRAKETAGYVADAILATHNNNNNATGIQRPPIVLYNNGVTIDERLRERNFGEWDLRPDRHYQDVWDGDVVDPYHTDHNVESVWSVTDRVTRCVVEWDAKLRGESTTGGCSCWWVVCVAHGDVLQILQTAFASLDPSQHRSMEHLETATLRPLQLFQGGIRDPTS
jgi:probable phosphoglycerate mutase